MSTNRKTVLRGLITPLVVAITAGFLGATVAVRPAAAATTEHSGWSCFETDACHEGNAECCDDKSFDHCTTMCDGCGGTGCQS
jgi:hypothetical protein